jgi:mono/diheme cytochrome c family protein
MGFMTARAGTIALGGLCVCPLLALGSFFARADVSTGAQQAASTVASRLYSQHCAGCHGSDGRSSRLRHQNAAAPDFTRAAWHERHSNAQLQASILNGKGDEMPAFRGPLNQQQARELVIYLRSFPPDAQADVDKMVAYVRALKDGKQVVEPGKQEVPAVSAKDDKVSPAVEEKRPPKQVTPDTANRLRGAAVLFRQYCQVCHGSDGTGSAMRASMSTLPDFTNGSWQRQHSDPQLLISILDGKGTRMPANRGRISESQGRDLVAYLRAFAPPGAKATALPASEFQREFERLQQEWAALERAAKKDRDVPSSPPP